MLDQDFTNLFAVTSAQIQAVAKKYLTAARRDVLVIQPAPPARRPDRRKGGSEMKHSVAILAPFARLPLAAQTVDRPKPPVSPRAATLQAAAGLRDEAPERPHRHVAEDARFPLVTVRLVFLAGNKRDPKDIPGLAASVAVMLMQGTPTRTYQQIAEELDGLGGTLNATHRRRRADDRCQCPRGECRRRCWR